MGTLQVKYRLLAVIRMEGQESVGHWVGNVPLFTAGVGGVCGLVSVWTAVQPGVFGLLANVPYLTVANLQLYRLLTAPLVCPLGLGLLLTVVMYVVAAARVEREVGTVAMGWRFGVNSEG